MEQKAKIFKNGRSQAVRLPKEFRFEGDEVFIRKVGRTVILDPVEKTEWPSKFWKAFTVDEEFTLPGPLPMKAFDLDL